MPQRAPARGAGGFARTNRNAVIGHDTIDEDNKILSQDVMESEQLQDISLKLNSEKIQSVKVGDEEFEMLMLDGYSHPPCLLHEGLSFLSRFLPCSYFWHLKIVVAGRG